MTAYQQAMMDFLGQLSLPVHLTGLTPDASHFPYLTCTMGCASFAGQTLLTATAWFLGGEANADRATLCDQAQRLIPEGGAQLTFSGGVTTLRPRGTVAAEDHLSRLCWVGDTAQGALLIELTDALNMTGATLTFTDQGEGTLPFEFQAHQSTPGVEDAAPCRILFFT